MSVSDWMTSVLQGRLLPKLITVAAAAIAAVAFEWTFNRHYVPDGYSLVLRYKGPPLPFLPGERPVSASGQFAKVDDRGRPLEKGVLQTMLGPGRHFVHYPISAGRFVNVVAFAPAGDWREIGRAHV